MPLPLIVGVAIGVATLAIIAGIMAWCCLRRHGRRVAACSSEPQSAASPFHTLYVPISLSLCCAWNAQQKPGESCKSATLLCCHACISIYLRC